MTKEDLFEIRKYLIDHCAKYDNTFPEAFAKRDSGHTFTLNEHVKGMIYAMLSNQRPWKQIESNLPEIGKLFFDYNPDRIKAENPDYFIRGLKNMKCGNMNIKYQMESLKHNIEIMEMLESKYGSMDAYVLSKSSNEIVEELSNSNSVYKLIMMGKALTFDYLLEVGIDACKPDRHLCRFLGSERMGSCTHGIATEKETIEQVKYLADEAELKMWEVDQIIWTFCAEGYGEICTGTPHCDRCVVNGRCHMKNKTYIYY